MGWPYNAWWYIVKRYSWRKNNRKGAKWKTQCRTLDGMMRRDNGYAYQNLKEIAVSKSMERLVLDTCPLAENLKKYSYDLYYVVNMLFVTRNLKRQWSNRSWNKQSLMQNWGLAGTFKCRFVMNIKWYLHCVPKKNMWPRFWWLAEVELSVYKDFWHTYY